MTALTPLLLTFLLAELVIVAAGTLLARSGESLSWQAKARENQDKTAHCHPFTPASLVAAEDEWLQNPVSYRR